MFLGEYRHTLDAKGRVSLPARFRSAISPQLVVSKGFDGCLYVYTAEEHLAFLSSIVADGMSACKASTHRCSYCSDIEPSLRGDRGQIG